MGVIEKIHRLFNLLIEADSLEALRSFTTPFQLGESLIVLTATRHTLKTIEILPMIVDIKGKQYEGATITLYYDHPKFEIHGTLQNQFSQLFANYWSSGLVYQEYKRGRKPYALFELRILLADERTTFKFQFNWDKMNLQVKEFIFKELEVKVRGNTPRMGF